MSEDKIQGGYILLSRKIIESEIWRKPPLYLKVWIWLLERAQHKEYKQLKRGQLFVSIGDIRAGVAWYVGYRKETPTKDQIFQILEWMRNPYESNPKATLKATMVATTRATHGMVIEILNYERYQNPSNYESNSESNNESPMKATRKQRQSNNINKECNKNERMKEEKKKDIEYTELFETAYKNFPRPQAKADTFKSWTALLKQYTEDQLLQFAENYRQYYESIPEADRPFPYSSNNFFGRKAYFLDFTEPRKWDGKPRAGPSKGPQNKGNFEQRKYNDTDIDKLYKEV